ncbi:hypothetical protein LI012_07720, partial [Caldibacillus thermoamylovorans]|uniref:hypothetical protein n=1 Tax=Caldibacillus thermoamylovorans TaxID=35841 RepID=UPI001D088CC0
EKILYFFGEQGKLHGNTAQPKKFYIFSVTREASVSLSRKRKCFSLTTALWLPKGPAFVEFSLNNYSFDLT